MRKNTRLNKNERIEILMMIGYGDKKQSFVKVVSLFKKLHPDREPICKFIVTKFLHRFYETGDVINMQRGDR